MPSQLWLISWILLAISLVFINSCSCLQVQGLWTPSSNNALKVIARFAIQKSVTNHKEETNGYVYGNFTILNHAIDKSKDSSYGNQYNSTVMLFVNRTLFKQIYNIYNTEYSENVLHSSTSKESEPRSFCERVYNLIEHKFYDPICQANITLTTSNDFVRYVPCPKGKSCNDLSKEKNLPNYQFTYIIDNEKQPTFWFLVLLSCQRKEFRDAHNNSISPKCTWTSSANIKSLISYDIWLTNGNPSSAFNNLINFNHQFSFEQQNLLMYIIINVSYVVLLVLQLYALSFQRARILNYLFTISLSLHCLAYFFYCLHMIVFAHNGKGFVTLNTIADIVKIFSTCLFILFVLMVAKAWPIVKPETFSKSMLLFIWSLYTFFKIFLFIWVKNSLNFIEEIDEYHTVPGWIDILCRVGFMLWFLNELRHTMILEQDSRRLKFYLHFGAGMLVWFVHLPLVAMVGLQIDLMWRYKLITGFTSAVDLIAYAIVTRLMLQRNPNQFAPLECDTTELNHDFDYYDDHSDSSETYKFTKSNYRSKPSYVNHINCDIKTIKS